MRSKVKYQINKKDDGRLYLTNFHPSGEPEAFICCVIKAADESLRLVQNTGVQRVPLIKASKLLEDTSQETEELIKIFVTSIRTAGKKSR